MNVFCFSGNLGADAQVRSTKGGKEITQFRVAVSAGYGQNEQTMWIGCNAWGERYTKIAQYLRKGSKVVVTGELSSREHNGNIYMNVRVNDLDLPPKPESHPRAQAGQEYDEDFEYELIPSQKPKSHPRAQAEQEYDEQFEDDLIPF